jgi:hypothetical protein
VTFGALFSHLLQHRAIAFGLRRWFAFLASSPVLNPGSSSLPFRSSLLRDERAGVHYTVACPNKEVAVRELDHIFVAYERDGAEIPAAKSTFADDSLHAISTVNCRLRSWKKAATKALG